MYSLQFFQLNPSKMLLLAHFQIHGCFLKLIVVICIYVFAYPYKFLDITCSYICLGDDFFFKLLLSLQLRLSSNSPSDYYSLPVVSFTIFIIMKQLSLKKFNHLFNCMLWYVVVNRFFKTVKLDPVKFSSNRSSTPLLLCFLLISSLFFSSLLYPCRTNFLHFSVLSMWL